MEIIESNQEGIRIYVLKNQTSQIYVTNYGATLLSCLTVDRNNYLQDIVLGYDTIEQYQNEDGYLGATLGRVANRIQDAAFTLNGTLYTLTANDGPNSLHGGVNSFSKKVFDTNVLSDTAIEFTYRSAHMEEGFPGNLDVKITYELNDNTLTIRYHAVSDADTLVNLSNHAYFSLDRSLTIHDHILHIKAGQYMPVDENGLVIGTIEDVDHVMDFRSPKPIRRALDADHEQIRTAKGLDHPYRLDAEKDPVILTSPASGLQLIVNTSYPYAHIYTANYLTSRKGSHGRTLMPQSALCIETQHAPDDIHRDPGSKTILRKGQTYDEWTTFTIRKA